jgi:hypothetical protein
MSHAGSKDFEKEDAARGFTERICEDIILRMKNDSNNNDTFLRHSYDEIANTRIIPAELKNASGNYVGWQVVISLTRKFNTCYNQSNWGI